MSKIFKINFDILDYKAKKILPDIDEYLKDDEILYMDEYQKGNIENCYWRREPASAIITNEFLQREAKRILRTGVWACIKEEIVWIPPNYYDFLQYFDTAGGEPQFRLKRLKHVYFKHEIRAKKSATGTYTIKNRQDGETTFAVSDALWEAKDGNMEKGGIGMQSKDQKTVELSCWRTMTMGWNSYPQWYRDLLYGDFVSGDRIAEKMKFMRQAGFGKVARDILITYGPSTHNAFDSMNNMRRCILDEVNKWILCSFFDTYTNYKKFIAPGITRKGLFDIFSSPADKNGKWNDEAYSFWKGSDPNDLDEYGNTSTGVWRYYSDPRDGIEGFYDKYGDADPDRILDWIKKERKKIEKTKPEKLMGEIRGYPLDEEEMFGAYDSGTFWDNHEGIKQRKIYLRDHSYKDRATKEPIKIYGNLERVDGYIDGDVVFRPADVTAFDVKIARFCFSHLPQNKEVLADVKKPPKYVEGCLGIDPYNLRHDPKTPGRKSNGAAVNYKFRDVFSTGVNKTPTMIYCNRPHHQNIFFEDMIKAAIFNRSLVQYENRSDKLANYFEDRGYFDWLLPEIGAKPNSNRKGDAPSSSKGAFLEEGMGLLNAFTGLPLTEGDPYLLNNVWFLELLEDMTNNFNPKDTHKADLTMAWFQALVGAVKILHKKIVNDEGVASGTLGYLLG